MTRRPDLSAGEVAVWRSRTTGHRATAYRTDTARPRFDHPQGEGAVRCHEHGTVNYYPTRFDAIHAVRHADQWCPQCAADAELVRSVPLLRRPPGSTQRRGDPGTWWAVADGVLLKIEGPGPWFIHPDLDTYLDRVQADNPIAYRDAARDFYTARGPGHAAWIAHNLTGVRRAIAARDADPNWPAARDAWHATVATPDHSTGRTQTP